MINIYVYGLDQFVVGDLSREITPLLAKLYEVKEESILFIAPNCLVFHNGAEQTSWNSVIKVELPKKVSVLEEKAKELLLHFFSEVCINNEVIFSYYSQDNYYEKINDQYPRYMKDDERLQYDTDETSEELEEGEGEDQIFTGDIFEGITH